MMDFGRFRFSNDDDIIVPLPTIQKHVRERGYGHIELFARYLSRNSPVKIEKLLIRAKNTVQVGSSSEKRKQQAKEAYALGRKIDPSKDYYRNPSFEPEYGKIVFEGIIDCSVKALKNDIPVGLGTDTGCPFITHYDMWREINYFVKYCGVSPTYALHTATLGNAKIVGIDGETGSIEAGKSADFIVCENNPLEDLSSLRNLQMVVFRGKVYDHPKIKKMKNVEQELDRWI